MKEILITLFLVLTQALNQYCDNINCTSCNSEMLNYQSQTCLNLCPTGFIINNSTNSCEIYSKSNIFTLKFNDFLNYSESSIGQFHHPESKPFKDTNKKSPIPTKDRGFYFAHTSALIAEGSWIPGPGFSTAIVIKVIDPGEIFSLMLTNETLFSVYCNSSHLIGKWKIYFSDQSFTYATVSALYNTLWNTIVFFKFQNSTLITVSLVIDEVDYSFSVYDAEFNPVFEGVSFIFGSLSSSFSGFLFSSIAKNLDFNKYIVNSNWISCNETEYLKDEQCYPCPGNDFWPLCVREKGNTCYSEYCFECTGYSFLDCMSCINGTFPGCINAKNCKDGYGFYCTECLEPYKNYSGLCIHKPNPLNLISKAISLNFNNISNIYEQTNFGSNSFLPNNKDPIPLKSRGFYFNGLSILQYKENIILNHEFTIAFWIFTIGKGNIFSSRTVNISSLGFMTIILSNFEESRLLSTSQYPRNLKTWVLYAFTVSFNNDRTTIKQYNDGLTTVNSLDGYAYYNSDDQVYIGGILNGSGFVGYIFILEIWQFGFDIGLHDVNPICADFTSSCAWICDSNMYYNYDEGLCLYCSDECTEGCSFWGTCQKCGGSCEDCLPSYNSTCNSNYPETNGKCLSDLLLRSDGNCCHKNCETCYGPYYFKCKSCSDGQYLHFNTCYQNCPLGYNGENGECINESTGKILSLSFDKIKEQTFDDISKMKFWSGNPLESYPSGRYSDPIPVINRGFYFNPDSVFTGESFILPKDFTINFWGKFDALGVVFKKGALEFSSGCVLSIKAERDYQIPYIYPFSYVCAAFNSQWHMFSLTVENNIHGLLNLYLNIFDQKDLGGNYNLANFTLVDDPNEVLAFGAFFQNSFKGFIYNFQIFSSSSSIDLAYEYNQSFANLWWPCQLNEFYEDNSCKSCDPSCTSGCVRGSDCILCADKLCSDCSSFTSECSKCFSTATLNETNECSCPLETYWNTLDNTCEQCVGLCEVCSGPLVSNCLSCKLYSEKNEFECVCTEGYYKVDNTCINCHSSCKICDGSNNNDCTDCADNSTLVNGECICYSGFFRDNTECKPCFELCEDCSGGEFYECSSCISNLTIQKNQTCGCSEGFFYNKTENSCIGCESSCLNCYGKEYYNCLECHIGEVLLDNMCMPQCPLGYLEINEKCGGNLLGLPYVQFIFDKLTGVVADNIFGTFGLTGNSEAFYPGMDENDPYPAYKRGFYFTGNTSYFSFPYNQSITLLGPNFHVSIWFLPEKTSSLLFAHFPSQDMNFNVSIISQTVQASFLIDNLYFSCRPENIINLDQWNLLIVSAEFNSKSEISFMINRDITIKYTETLKPYKDLPKSLFYLSSFPECVTSYKGFIYSIEIYFQLPTKDKLFYQGLCDGCSICLSSGDCIPECDITNFSHSKSCQSCSDTCKTGCRSSNTCNLCIDPNCVSCSSYEKSTCEICLPGYEQINSTCLSCKEEYFYDSITLTCKKCISTCLTCLSEIECITCIANSTLNLKQECICDQGFYFYDFKCERKLFTAFVSIDFSNKVSLSFSEDLIRSLEKKDIYVFINKESIEFQIIQISLQTYIIEPSLKKQVVKGDKIKIRFENEIISNVYSLLITKEVSINMHGVKKDDIVEMVNKAKEYCNIAGMMSVGVSVGSSLMITDPTFFFNFLTAVEVYSYVALFNLDLDPILIDFFNSLSPMSKVPNAFKLFITDSKPIKIDEKFSNFGYDSNLLLINSGVFFTIISAILVLIPFIFLFPKVKYTFFNKIIDKLKSSYKYRVFLRIYIQSFFEISINSLLAIETLDINTRLHIFDLITCGFCMTFLLVSTFVLIKVVSIRNSINEENLPEFLNKFGTFFEEFKPEKGKYLYFIFFILRRAAFVSMIMFVEPGIIQLLVSSIFSLAIILYLLYLSPYQNQIIGLYTLLNESLTLSFYLFLLIPFISDIEFSNMKIAKVSIFIVISALVLNSLFGVIIMVSKVIACIKNCRMTKVHNLSTENHIITATKFDIFTRKIISK